MSAAGAVLIFQGGLPTFVDPTALPVPSSLAGMGAALAAANAVIMSLAQRVAALEGRPDPCVALSGSLPVASIQVGTVDLSVPVPGLLPTDHVAVELMADLPAGLVLGSMRPGPTAGTLLVQATATLSLAGKAAVPIAVTALR